VTDLALWLLPVAPAVSFGISGIALLPTRSRMAGAMMVVGAAGVLAAVVSGLAGADGAAQIVLVCSLWLPVPMALLAYPRASLAHAADYCAWVVVVGAGVIGASTMGGEETITLGTVIALALIGHAWWLLETGDERDKEPILWLALGTGTTALLFAIAGMVAGAAGVVVGVVLISAVGPAMAIGIKRPEVADVRSLVVETVVFGVVAISYVASYVGVFGLLALAGWEDPSEATYAFVGVGLAVGFHPLRVVLRGLIDELLFGDRPDPLSAATAVADRIGDDPLLALRAIREALVLPYATVTADGVELASSGTPVTDTRRFPLSLGSDSVGELVVGLRPGDLSLGPGDVQVLQIVGPLLAQTLRARALTEELKASRGSAIAAIEEERRRLRRDLHDGLGPTLSGIALTADAARNSIATDPEGADALLAGLRRDAATAVGEIRRLVYGMRPPALDELGLVPALRQQVASVRNAVGEPMQVIVDAANLAPLPAAVEVAAYRIATEAVSNAARHSGTDRAWVRLDLDGDVLEIQVRDAGCVEGDWVPGVGLSSMRERAAEVGGTLQVTMGANGTTVHAELPVG
jgi:signal transduction histidine kinase